MRKWGDGSKPQHCVMDDCGKPVIALGLCNGHYKIALEIEKRMKENGTVVQMGGNGRYLKGGPGSGKTGWTGGGGKPPVIVNDEATIKRIRDLAGLQCTQEEIAGVLQIHRESLRNFFEQYPEARAAFEEGRLNGRASLRRMQFVQAKRSAAMGIWLGKNYLDQRDSLRLGPIESQNMQYDPASEEAPSALLRAVKGETE